MKSFFFFLQLDFKSLTIKIFLKDCRNSFCLYLNRYFTYSFEKVTF